MKILYVDESGNDALNGGTNHFVLLGLMIDAESWKKLDRKISKIKSKYGLENEEIHTAWMARRYTEQEKIDDFENLTLDERRKNADEKIGARAAQILVKGKKTKIKSYRREVQTITPYLHLTRDQRLECLIDLSKEIGSWTETRIFADVISKSDFQNSQMTVYEMAFEQVLSRYQAYLESQNARGIVVHDNNEKVAKRLTSLARKYHKSGTLYRKIVNIVETPLFVDSKLTSMIQMTDICAFALRRFVENQETYLWNTIKKRVDRRGKLDVGVRHYTGSRKCSCDLCLAHGRKKRS